MNEGVIKKKDIRLTHKGMLVLSGILGFLWFLLWYGYECLDFTNVNWIYNSYNDLTTHYIGWVHYRNYDWSFPLGFFYGLTGEYNNSIVYTDSIPLLAIFFKVFRGILPDTFQYFGFFSLASVILQAVCGSELVYRLTGKTKESLIASILFLSATVLSRRLFDHTSLTCHALILVALMLFFETEEKRKNISIKWNVLLLIAVSIHAYYIPMLMALELFYYIKVSKLKDWLKVAAKMIISSIMVVLIMYILGYFGVASYSVDNDTLGFYGTSLNALFYGQGYSLTDMLRGDVNNVWELEEGYAYLGLGTLVLAAIAVGYVVYDIKKHASVKVGKTVALVICLFWIFVVLSMVPTIRWNWDKVYTIKLPIFVQKILGIFRSNGRFIWPAFYLVMLSASTIVIRKSRYSIAIVSMGVLIQMVDLAPYYTLQSEDMDRRVEQEFVSELISNVPYDLDYIMLMDEPNSNDGIGFDETCMIGIYSAYSNTSLSDFYMARKDERALSAMREAVSDDIANNHIEDGWVYIFISIPYEYLVDDVGLYFYPFDGMICGMSKKIEGVQELNLQEGIDMIAVNGYVDIDVASEMVEIIDKVSDKVELEPGHIMYRGANLPGGEYIIRLCGEGLIDVITDIAGDDCVYNVVEQSDECIVVEMFIEENQSRIHLQFYNAGDEMIYVEKMEIAK